MGGCTAYVKCCMCDDSVGHKHAIRKFEEVLTSRVEHNEGVDDPILLNVSPQRQVGLVGLGQAVGGLDLILQMQADLAALKIGKFR